MKASIVHIHYEVNTFADKAVCWLYATKAASLVSVQSACLCKVGIYSDEKPSHAYMCLSMSTNKELRMFGSALNGQCD